MVQNEPYYTYSPNFTATYSTKFKSLGYAAWCLLKKGGDLHLNLYKGFELANITCKPQIDIMIDDWESKRRSAEQELDPRLVAQSNAFIQKIISNKVKLDIPAEEDENEVHDDTEQNTINNVNDDDNDGDDNNQPPPPQSGPSTQPQDTTAMSVTSSVGRMSSSSRKRPAIPTITRVLRKKQSK